MQAFSYRTTDVNKINNFSLLTRSHDRAHCSQALFTHEAMTRTRTTPDTLTVLSVMYASAAEFQWNISMQHVSSAYDDLSY